MKLFHVHGKPNVEGLCDCCRAMMRFAIGKSDLLTAYKAYEGWREARKAGRAVERLYLEEVCVG